MATNDTTLKSEVREQTELTDSALLSDSRLTSLLSNAKREIESEVGSEPDWYGDRTAENALFWLLCLFAIGEDSVEGFSIGEIQVDPETDDNNTHPWTARYNRSLRYLMPSESLFGISKVNRTDRDSRQI